MSWNLFDAYFKNKLLHASQPVPAHVWENIEKQLDKKKNPAFWISWRGGLTIAGIFIATLLGVSHYLPTWNNTKAVPTPSRDVPATNTTSPIEETIKLKDLASTTLQSQLNSAPLTNTTQNNTNTTINKTQLIHPSNPTSSSKNTIQSSDVKVSTQNFVHFSSELASSNSIIGSQSSQSNSLNEINSNSDLSNTKNSVRNEGNLKENSGAFLLHGLPASVLDKQVKPEIDRKIHINKCLTGTDVGCFGNTSALRFLTLDVLLGGGTALHLLTPKSSEYTSYVQQRKDTESGMLTTGASIRGTGHLRNNKIVSFQVSYTNLHSTFNWVAENTKIEVTHITNSNPPDTFYTVSYGKRTVSNNNNIHMLDFGIQAGMEWQKRRFGYYISGGPVFNLYMGKSGKYFIPNQPEPVSLTSIYANKLTSYKTQAGVGLMLCGGLQYRLNRDFEWLIQPEVRYQLSSLTIDEYPVKEKVALFQLQSGLRYRF